MFGWAFLFRNILYLRNILGKIQTFEVCIIEIIRINYKLVIPAEKPRRSGL